MSEKNLYQRLAAITAELQTVQKNLSIDAGKSKYKAVSERDVIDAVKPLEAKHGVFSFPVSRETLESEILKTETQYGEKTNFYVRLKTVYRFLNIDDPKDYIDMDVFSVGIDPQDKADGKAMTYGDKYALLKAYKISTGDDPDATPSEEAEYKPKPKTVPRPEQTPRPEKKEDASTGDFVPTCADCGAEISVKVHDFSVKQFKRPLCIACQNKARNAG